MSEITDILTYPTLSAVYNVVVLVVKLGLAATTGVDATHGMWYSGTDGFQTLSQTTEMNSLSVRTNWNHDKHFVLLAICGESTVTGGSPHKVPVVLTFGDFFNPEQAREQTSRRRWGELTFITCV